jgi:putative peptidoglycan lipid II flippase
MSLMPDQTPPFPTASRLSLSERLSGKHTAFSATLLLMVSSMLSGLLGLVRTKYIAHVFGAGHTTDAYNAAFNLPDMIN